MMEQNDRRRGNQRQRTSRAAQAAEQRRIERRERERLENLREKQKKKAKRRTRKRVNPTTWKRLLIMAGVVLAVVLSMLIFFRVRTVSVVGNSYYTAEEIAAAAGTAQGDNLLTISRAKISGNILAELPYIRTVKVTRQLPDTLVLTVTEYEVTYAVCTAEGEYYLVTADGKITEQVDERTAKEHVQISGFTVLNPEIGAKLQIAGETVVTEGQLAAMSTLLREIEASELTKSLASVEIPASYELAIWYGDQYYVKLGNAENLAYKLEYLKEVLAKLENYQSGTIDLSFSEGNEARFTPNQ